MGELNDLEFPNYSDKLPVLPVFIHTASLLIIRLLRLAITFTRPLVLISLNSRNPCLIFLTICTANPNQRELSERIKVLKIKPRFSEWLRGKSPKGGFPPIAAPSLIWKLSTSISKNISRHYESSKSIKADYLTCPARWEPRTAARNIHLHPRKTHMPKRNLKWEGFCMFLTKYCDRQRAPGQHPS